MPPSHTEQFTLALYSFHFEHFFCFFENILQTNAAGKAITISTTDEIMRLGLHRGLALALTQGVLYIWDRKLSKWDRETIETNKTFSVWKSWFS